MDFPFSLKGQPGSTLRFPFSKASASHSLAGIWLGTHIPKGWDGDVQGLLLWQKMEWGAWSSSVFADHLSFYTVQMFWEYFTAKVLCAFEWESFVYIEVEKFWVNLSWKVLGKFQYSVGKARSKFPAQAFGLCQCTQLTFSWLPRQLWFIIMLWLLILYIRCAFWSPVMALGCYSKPWTNNLPPFPHGFSLCFLLLLHKQQQAEQILAVRRDLLEEWAHFGISLGFLGHCRCPCSPLAALAVERHHLRCREALIALQYQILWRVQLPLEGDRIHTLTGSMGMTGRDFPLFSWWKLKRNTR